VPSSSAGVILTRRIQARRDRTICIRCPVARRGAEAAFYRRVSVRGGVEEKKEKKEEGIAGIAGIVGEGVMYLSRNRPSAS